MESLQAKHFCNISSASLIHALLTALWFSFCHLLSFPTTEVHARPHIHTYTITSQHINTSETKKQHITSSAENCLCLHINAMLRRQRGIKRRVLLHLCFEVRTAHKILSSGNIRLTGKMYVMHHMAQLRFCIRTEKPLKMLSHTGKNIQSQAKQA